MGLTSIEWTERTWNPVRGCSRVSPGCKYCYAERTAARFSKSDLENHNNGDQPFHGFVQITNGHPQWTGKVELIEDKLDEPLHWRKPARVFVNSMSDLFHESLPDEAIDRVFAAIGLCPQHTFQVLTKRAGRMLRFISNYHSRHPNLESWPLPNVWLGVSAEDQPCADGRIPLLLQAPAAVRFVSYEPALGPVDFAEYFRRSPRCPTSSCIAMDECSCLVRAGLDWVIVGGESGPGARPFDVQWARDTIRQCREAGVACFVKQMGAHVVDRNDAGFEGDTPSSWPMDTAWTELDSGYQGAPVRILLNDRKGGDMAEWPEDLRVREMPT